jgi:glycosyltransferase involved in cell wall biosynthesis
LAIVGGEGWKCRTILEQIGAKEALGGVRYLGRVEDEELSLLYSAAELMVYPSAYEGFGLPVLEAMTCGCPVLCSWSSSLPEVAGPAAHYFRPHDHDDLARQLGLLLADREELDKMSQLGLRQASLFSFRSAAREFLSILSRLAARGMP